MTLDELIQKTMSDPTLIWASLGVSLQFLQTVFLVVSAAVVIIQIRQFQRELVEKTIAGLREAINILETDDFNRVSKEAAAGRGIEGVQWHKLLDNINFVALLLSKKYTDEDLLFSLKGEKLATIGAYLESDSLPAEIKNELVGKYRPAMNLMYRARNYRIPQK